MEYPDEYNPFFHVEQGFWCQKDVFSQGFLGSASRIYIEFGGTYTPAVASDIGKTVKDDGVYSGVLVGYWNSETDYLHLPTSVDPSDPTAPTWWLVGYYPIASGSTITIPSGIGGGVTNAGWATQPGGGAVMVGHGLTGPDDPPKTVLSSSALGFNRYHFVDIEGNLADTAVKDAQIDIISGRALVVGSDTTDASGDCTVTFPEEFDAAPKVFLQAVDADGKGITIDVISKSTTQFVVKARSAGTHKHKIGQAAATADWTMAISNAGDHYHGFGMENGGAAVDLAHSHTLAETLSYVGGNTGDGGAHGHTLTNKAPWARGINLRDIDGVAVEAGATMMTSEKAAVDLYTEETTAVGVEADFDWLAIPA